MRTFALALLLLLPVAQAEEPTPGPAPEPPTDTDGALEAFLIARDYVAVPLTRQILNHLQVEAVIDGHPVVLLVDTGATASVVDATVAKAWKLDTTAAPVSGFGIGDGSTKVTMATVQTVRVGDVETGPRTVFAADLSSLRSAVKRMGGTPPDGLLGADFLQDRHAVLEVATSRLYLRR